MRTYRKSPSVTTVLAEQVHRFAKGWVERHGEWPSHGQICLRCGIRPPALGNILNRAIQLGLIEREYIAENVGQRTMYRYKLRERETA